jgi:dephospho-CoA kinase
MGRPRRSAGPTDAVRAVVFGISGRIASGKSTIANALAERFDCPVASFGSYVRSIAREGGIDPEDRQALQELGESLITSLGWEDFCRRTIATVGYSEGSIVVDGVRHFGAAEALRLIVAPATFLLVAIEVDEDVRRRRIERRGIAQRAGGEADQHRSESEVFRLMESADVVVAPTKSIDEAVEKIVQHLRVHGLAGSC